MKAALGTRKGVIIVESKASNWNLSHVNFDGVSVNFVKKNPHDESLWAGVNHGHWGPKLHKSTDGGKTFQEIGVPKFPEPDKLKDFWGMEWDSKGRYYLSTAPAGLFYSDDDGKSWKLSESLHTCRGKENWFGGGADETALHSILVHPKNDDHLTIGISCAGVLQSKDRGLTWNYTNNGQKAYFLPDPDSEVGQDPHLVERSLSDSRTLWQQNHCGIFKSEDDGNTWIDLSKKPGLHSSFGWAIAIDENDPKIVYTVPALSDENRIPKDYKLCVQKTLDGGENWKVMDKGLPSKNCWDICYRHALALEGQNLLFGTTTGNLFFSRDGAESFETIFGNLPPIYSVHWI
jgi:hypothetical protein